MNKSSLASVLDKVIDYRGKTPKKLGGEWTNKGYRALSALNVKTDGLDNIDSIRYVDEALYRRWMKQEIKRGDILLTSEAPAGQVMYWDSDEKIVLSQRLFALRTNNKVNPLYLKYFLQSGLGQRSIFNKLSGSTVAGISAKMFDIINVFYPEREEQDKIASLLYSIDKKINVNTRINEKLESIVHLIYNQWFVQFDFPDANNRPYKSAGGAMTYSAELKREVPVGWESDTLDRFGTIVGGSTPSTKDSYNFSSSGTPWITPNDLSTSRANKFISRGAQSVSDLGIKSASLKIYPAGTILLSSRAPVGYMAIAKNEITTNQGFKSFVPNKNYHTEFVYYAVKNSLNAIIQYASGSTFKEISGATLKTVKSSIPPESIAKKYASYVSSIFEQQALLETENQKLTSIRDELLPMLMTGQAKIESVSTSLSAALAQQRHTHELSAQEKKVQRKMLACYVANASLKGKNFGKTKFEKLLHLIEYHVLKKDLGQKYSVQPAGPYDGGFTILFWKDVVDKSKWYKFEGYGNLQKVLPGEKHTKSLKDYGYLSDNEKKRINEFLDIFKDWDYKAAEVISTLYAVWNNRLIKGEDVTDSLIKHDFLQWDPQKQQYFDRLDKALLWMRDNNIVPDGWGKEVMRAK